MATILEDYRHSILNMILSMSEEEFWKVVDLRLSIPFSKNQNLEYWTEEHLIDETFLQLARTKEIVNHNGKSVNVYKYYNQAFRLRKWVHIAKPTPEFIVNLSDLTTRIISELKTLDKDGSQYVLKQAVGRIFENINARQYHLSIARKLKVGLDK